MPSGMALAFRITGGLSAGFTAATGQASRQLSRLKGEASELSAELTREQAALRGAAKGTQEYSDRLQRIEQLKGRLRGLSGDIQSVGAQTRRKTQAMAAARAGMVRTVAVSGAVAAALGATAFATARTAREYLELKLSAASAGVEAGVLAADIRRGTAVLGGNADAAKSAAKGALDYQKNLALLSVGLGQVDHQVAHTAGINPYEQLKMSAEEVRADNLRAIRAAKGLGDELERTRSLAALEIILGPEHFRSLYQYTDLTAAQRAEVDALAERQKRATAEGAAGWSAVSHRMGLLRGETGLLSQTFGSVFSPALESVTGRLTAGVQTLTGWIGSNRTASQAVGYAAVVVGGLGAAVLAGITIMAGYRAVLWSVTGATRTGAAVDALRTSLIWRMTGAVTTNTLAAGRNAAAWIAGRAVMLASAVATGVATGAVTTNTLAAGRNAAAWIAGRAVMLASAVATGVATGAVTTNTLAAGRNAAAWIAGRAVMLASAVATGVATGAVTTNTLAAGRNAAAWIAGRAVMLASAVATGVATGAVTTNTLAAGRNAAAWIAGRAVMLASAVATGVATGAQWLLNVALTANPIGIVIAAVAGLIGGLVLLYRRSEGFRNIVNSVWATLKRFWPVLLGPIGIAVKGFQLLYNRIEFIRAALDKVFGAAKKVGGVVKGVAGFLGFGGGDDETSQGPPGPPPGGPPPGAPRPDYGFAAAAAGQPQATPDYGFAAAAAGQPQAGPGYDLATGQPQATPDYGFAAAAAGQPQATPDYGFAAAAAGQPQATPDYGFAAAATGQPQATPDYGFAAAAAGQPQAGPGYDLATGQPQQAQAGLPETRLVRIENTFHISGVTDVEAVAQRVIELQDESLSELL